MSKAKYDGSKILRLNTVFGKYMTRFQNVEPVAKKNSGCTLALFIGAHFITVIQRSQFWGTSNDTYATCNLENTLKY